MPVTYGPRNEGAAIIPHADGTYSLASVNLNATAIIVRLPVINNTFAAVQWDQLTGTTTTVEVELLMHINPNSPASFGSPIILSKPSAAGSSAITKDIDVRDADYITLRINTAEGGTSTADFWVRFADDQRS